MTSEQNRAVQTKSNFKYDIAKRIRAILDEAAREYGEAQWEQDSAESEILDLVSGDQ